MITINLYINELIRIFGVLLALVRGQIILFPKPNTCLLRVYGRLKIRGVKKNIKFGKGVLFLGDATLVCGWDAPEGKIEIGNNVTVEDGSYINAHGGYIHLNNRVFIGVGCILQGKGGIIIEQDSMLGPYVQIYSSDHQIDNFEQPYRLQPERSSLIRVGENVWIGASSILLKGTYLASNAVVAAGSIVKMRIEEPALIASKYNLAEISRLLFRS